MQIGLSGELLTMKLRRALSFSRRAILCSGVGMALLASGPAMADSANIPASATVIPPFAVSEVAELRFGTLASSLTSGSIVVDLPALLPATAPTTAAPIINSTRSNTGGTALIGGTTCSAIVQCGAASVQLSGNANSAFSTITMPATFTVSSGADNMTVGTLRVRYGILGTAGVTTGAGTLSATGTGLLVLTGTLFVNATQASGGYTGTLNVTIDY